MSCHANTNVDGNAWLSTKFKCISRLMFWQTKTSMLPHLVRFLLIYLCVYTTSNDCPLQHDLFCPIKRIVVTATFFLAEPIHFAYVILKKKKLGQDWFWFSADKMLFKSEREKSHWSIHQQKVNEISAWYIYTTHQRPKQRRNKTKPTEKKMKRQ